MEPPPNKVKITKTFLIERGTKPIVKFLGEDEDGNLVELTEDVVSPDGVMTAVTRPTTTRGFAINPYRPKIDWTPPRQGSLNAAIWNDLNLFLGDTFTGHESDLKTALPEKEITRTVTLNAVSYVIYMKTGSIRWKDQRGRWQRMCNEDRCTKKSYNTDGKCDEHYMRWNYMRVAAVSDTMYGVSIGKTFQNSKSPKTCISHYHPHDEDGTPVFQNLAGSAEETDMMERVGQMATAVCEMLGGQMDGRRIKYGLMRIEASSNWTSEYVQRMKTVVEWMSGQKLVFDVDAEFDVESINLKPLYDRIKPKLSLFKS